MGEKKRKKKIPLFLFLVSLFLAAAGLLVYGKKINEGLKRFFGSGQENTVNSYILYPEKEKKKGSIRVTYINQHEAGYPTGCESASAVMAMNYSGVSITLEEFIENDLAKEPVRYEKAGSVKTGDSGKKGEEERKILVGPDPEEAFAGDPKTKNGYGCYRSVIERAVEHVSVRKKVSMSAVDLTGKNLEKTVKKYIDEKLPVIVWVTNKMQELKDGTKWTIRGSGEEFVWPKGEHCILITGYDTENFYYHDPVYGEDCSAPKKDVERAYGLMGKQAMVVLGR